MKKPRSSSKTFGTINTTSAMRVGRNSIFGSGARVVGETQQVLPVCGTFQRLRERPDLRGGDQSHSKRDLFRAGDLQSLAGLDRLDKRGCLHQRLMSSRIEPCDAASQQLDVEAAVPQVAEIDVGDFIFAASGSAQPSCDIDDVTRITVEARDSVTRLRDCGFLLDADCFPGGIELHHAIATGIADEVGEYRRAVGLRDSAAELVGNPMSVENIVAKDQADRRVGDELCPEHESLCESF